VKEVYSLMLPETIKMIRQKVFLSQEAFASEIKVSVSTINRWETGKVRPNLTAMKNIKQFCEKYSLSFEEVEREWFDYGNH
jgi:DNA-binding transcriptional regulator YiaG